MKLVPHPGIFIFASIYALHRSIGSEDKSISAASLVGPCGPPSVDNAPITAFKKLPLPWPDILIAIEDGLFLKADS